MKEYKVNSIHLEITGKCNLKCKYCYNSQFNDECRFCDEMDTNTIKKLIDEAKEMGCKRFIFSGGEPFTRNDFFEILSYCKDLKVEILTNSSLLTDEYIMRLKNMPQISEIKISLDGFESHDVTRIGSSHQQVINTIKNLKKQGFKVVINTEVTALSIKDFWNLYLLLKDLKIDRWRVDLPFILGRDKETYDQFKLPDFEVFINEVKKILIDYLKEKPSFEIELFNIFKSELTPDNNIEFDYETHPCAYREGSFPMRPNGDMIFCPSLDIPMANYVKEGNLRKTIQKKYTNKFYDIKIKDFSKCLNCRYINLCNTGCRVDALYYMGDCYAVDPVCCNLMPLIESEIVPILPIELRKFYESLISVQKAYPDRYNIDDLVLEKQKHFEDLTRS